MPLYEYECSQCGKRFERIQKFSDQPVETCPSCGGRVTQLLSPPGLQFKGSGWYVTDYARKSSSSEEPKTETKQSETSDKPAATKASED